MDDRKDAVPNFTNRHQPYWPSVIVLAVCALFLTLSMLLAITPERYNLQVGDIAPKTITATKDVVDEFTTELRKERAAENVPPSYREDENATDRVLTHYDAVFDDFEKVRACGEDIRSGTIRTSDVTRTYDGTFTREDLDYAKKLSSTIPLSDWQLTILMKQNADDLQAVYRNTSNIMLETMQSTIREGQLEAAIAAIQRLVLQTTSSDLSLTVAMPAIRECLEPNMIIDQEATEANREIARSEVESSVYKSGQNIVVAGERVTSAQLAVLESLGLLEGNRSDTLMIMGVILLGGMSMLSLLFHVMQADKTLMRHGKNALILGMIFLLTMGICLLASQLNPYLVPASMVLLLTASVLTPNLALESNILALIFVGVLTGSNAAAFGQQLLMLLFVGALSAPAGIYIIGRGQNRSSILVAGLLMAAASFVNMISIGLLTNSEIRMIVDNAIWSAGGNVLAALLCLGIKPLLEWMFDLITTDKLLELANPNQPLMRRLLVETPGTYHHSILLANLAEAAAEAIGADPLLSRIGAYYHDIGKLKRPQYFKENQLTDNPHDMTDPRISAAIIAEHVSDGVQIARQAHLPETIIRFIMEHHGDTQISFFYQKMRSMAGGETARPEDFQYPGPKPQTRETALVMLADTVEAAIRAGGNEEADVIEQRIMELVKEKIDSGQLNDSPLKFGDIAKIIKAFTQVLTGIYHKRIAYPRLNEAAAAMYGDAETGQRHGMRIVEPPEDENAPGAK